MIFVFNCHTHPFFPTGGFCFAPLLCFMASCTLFQELARLFFILLWILVRSLRDLQMHPRATQDMIKMMISIIKLIIWYSGMQLPDMAIPWKTIKWRISISKRCDQVNYRSIENVFFSWIQNLLNLVVNELETIFCFKKSMFANNTIQHTGILNQLNFQPNKMLSTIFVDVHPKLHMFIKLWSNISVLYNSRSLSNNNNALTNSIPTNIFHRTNLWVVNSHSFIWNVQQKIRNILCMICYIFFSIPSKLQYIH